MRGRSTLVGAMLLLSGCGVTSAPTTPSPSATATPSPGITVTATALRAVAGDFFSDYLACMTDPPAEAAGGVSEYCQTHNPLGSNALAANLIAGGVAAAGADPLTCGQNPPMGIAVETATVADATGGAVIVRAGYRPAPLLVIVDVVAEDEGLRVTDVHCPAP